LKPWTQNIRRKSSILKLHYVVQANPATVPGFAGAEAICNPVTTSGNPTMGSTAILADGIIPQLGAATIIQNTSACSIPLGFSAGGKLLSSAANLVS
jgi:hypothetical protein